MGNILRPHAVAAIGLAVGGLLVCVACHADSAAQAQQAVQQECDRSAACYQRMDLDGYMAMDDPAFKSINVAGDVFNYRQMLAGIATDFSIRRDVRTARATVHAVTLRGGLAYTRIEWHFASRTATYVHTRDYSTLTVWVKRPAGWRQTSAQMTADTSQFRRIASPKPPAPSIT